MGHSNSNSLPSLVKKLLISRSLMLGLKFTLFIYHPFVKYDQALSLLLIYWLFQILVRIFSFYANFGMAVCAPSAEAIEG